MTAVTLLRAGRYAGLAAVATLYVSMGLGLRRTGLPVTGPEPLSSLGTDSRAAVVFSVGLIVAAVLLGAFAWSVRQRYRTGPAFLASFLIGLAGQVVAAVVPIDGPGAAHPVHTAAGLTLGASLPVLMWRFAAAQPAGPWRRASYGLFWLEAAACVVGIALSQASMAPVAEIVPAAAFHLWIAVVTVRWSRTPAATADDYRTRGLYLIR